MELFSNTFPCRLIVLERQMEKTVVKDQTDLGLPVVITEYFPSLEDGFCGLLQQNIEYFERLSDASQNAGKYFETATLVSDNILSKLEVHRVSIEEAITMEETAGLYWICEKGISSFEREVGFSFSNFTAYQGNIDQLAFATYSFDMNRFKIIPDKGFEQLQQVVRNAEQLQGPGSDSCCLSVSVSNTAGQRIAVNKYHFSSIKEAFLSLLLVPPQFFDRQIQSTAGSSEYIKEAEISTQSDHRIAVVASVNEMTLEETSAIYGQPGIYLDLNMTAFDFEKVYGIELSHFPNVEVDDNLLLIAEFSKDRSSVITRLPSANEQEHAVDEIPMYCMEIETAHRDGQKEISAQSQHFFFTDIADAISAIMELPSAIFAMEYESPTEPRMVFKRAIIKEGANELMVRHFRQETESLAGGVYIDIFSEHLTLGMLSEIGPLIRRAQEGQKSVDNFLLITTKENHQRKLDKRQHRSRRVSTQSDQDNRPKL